MNLNPARQPVKVLREIGILLMALPAVSSQFICKLVLGKARQRP